jgi:hypothetical protein
LRNLDEDQLRVSQYDNGPRLRSGRPCRVIAPERATSIRVVGARVGSDSNARADDASWRGCPEIDLSAWPGAHPTPTGRAE